MAHRLANILDENSFEELTGYKREELNEAEVWRFLYAISDVRQRLRRI